MSTTYQWLFHELRTISLEDYLSHELPQIAEKLDFRLGATKERNLKISIKRFSAYGENAYLTHILPLRPYERTLLHVVIVVKGIGNNITVILTITQSSPSPPQHKSPSPPVGITRLKPGIFKGFILKKEGISVQHSFKMKRKILAMYQGLG